MGETRAEDEKPTNKLTEEELRIEKNLRWKLDTWILPLVCLTFFLNCIDRTNYTAARLQNIQEELNLSETQYQIGLCLYYIGYILCQVPSNILLNYHGRPSLHIGICIIVWGCVTGCTATVQGFGGILACRMFLGFAEAPLYPGIMFYLTKWYTKAEITLRISIYLSAGLLANAFGSLIAAGISSGMDGLRGLSAWRWLYILEGIVSVCSGICINLFLPNFPHTWKALSPEMRKVAIRRLTLDALEVDIDQTRDVSRVEGLRLALGDIKLYIMALINMGILGAMGFQNFFPTLTATLGYGHIVSLLLAAPPFVFVAIYSNIHSYLSDRAENRFWYIMYPAPIAITGFVLFMSVSNFGVRYFATFLMTFVYPMNNTISAWIATSISRPTAKRAAAYGIISMVSNTPGLWTPFTYRGRDAPHYCLGLGICIGLVSMSTVLSICLRILLVRENRRLDKLTFHDAPLTRGELARLEKTAEAEGIDLAAARRLQQGFRYTL